MTRREALRKFYNVIVAVGASSFFTFEDLLALDAQKSTIKKPNLIWLQGSACSGCSLSLTDIEDISFMDFLLKFTHLIYHQNFSTTTDVAKLLNQAKDALDGDYLLVFEGSIPTALPHACIMADIPMVEWAITMATHSKACIAVGTCASFGGITTMHGIHTGASPLIQVLKDNAIDKPILNLPNCPLKPEHLIYTLLHYIKFETFPSLDSQARPKIFFSQTIHETCSHFYEFQENIFATKINEKGCLFELGCQGTITKSDCMLVGHNGNTNNCIKAGHPCIGCASEHFPRQIMFRAYNDNRVITPLKDMYFAKIK